MDPDDDPEHPYSLITCSLHHSWSISIFFSKPADTFLGNIAERHTLTRPKLLKW